MAVRPAAGLVAECNVAKHVETPPKPGERLDRGGDSAKLFIGGIGWKTSNESLAAYFASYGEVSECTLLVHKVGAYDRSRTVLAESTC